MRIHNSGWHFWVDIGGTFTDIIAKSPADELIVHKLLSSQPDLYGDPVIKGIESILSQHKESLDQGACIDEIRLGTTIATNALLERKGSKTALLITKGFKDALQIAYQNRPDIFALEIKLPQPLYQTVVEIKERVSAQGKVLIELDLNQVKQQLQLLCEEGFESIAIVLLHSYQYPAHEQVIAKLAQQVGFKYISASHALTPLIKLIPRGDTCVVNAYLAPVLQDYMQQLLQRLKAKRFYLMQSNGGLTTPAHFHAKDAILSGPAGGIVGAVKSCVRLGIQDIIGFDMGGTSTDVCHYKGKFERTLERNIAGVRLSAPMLAIDTVAAGGGSICRFSGGEMRVGPQSAGADPGPACYGKGGPLTITDCHVLLGHLQAKYFPKVFSKSGDQPLDEAIVQKKFSHLAKQMAKQTGESLSKEQLASGFIEIATEHMANAIKRISIARGHDVSHYTLVSFGGAAGQHACGVAEQLGIKQIVSHPCASVLSALGIGLAPLSVIKQRSYFASLTSEAFKKLEKIMQLLCDRASQELVHQGAYSNNIELNRYCYIAYQNSDAELMIKLTEFQIMQADFEACYQHMFGYKLSDTQIEVRRLRVEASASADLSILTQLYKPNIVKKPKPDQTTLTYQGKCMSAPIYLREQIAMNEQLYGPSIIVEPQGCQLIPKNWQIKVGAQGAFIISRQLVAKHEARKTRDNAVIRALFGHKFMAIAEQMGSQLRKTALSVNIKERLDFSCALFNKQGELIANAPHLPVHLGSMGESVKAIIAKFSKIMDNGDDYILNSPFHGGTHLPDLTVISPVFIGDTYEFFVASRAHHADIGGKTPGSFPADSKTIQEEGVILQGEKISTQGNFLIDYLTRLLTEVKYPVRNLQQNIGDIQAQLAANQKGIQGLRQLVRSYGLNTVQQQMKLLLDHGEGCVKAIIPQLKQGQCTLPLDNGAHIKVNITVHSKQQTATIDFSGSSQQLDNNFNAPYAVTRAAVLYVFRTLVQEEIPLNDGCLRPLHLIVEKRSFLNPVYPAAVVAGNVETSQHIVDALYQVLGVLAGSQGTMNNVLFGTEKFQYYETLCGGAGAGRGFNGASAVHTHMTNSRLTDVEILELRYPVLVEEFSIRKHSSGKGQHQGGDGIVRVIKFLQAMQLSLLTSHRKIAPKGLAGGEDGKCGENYLHAHNGKLIRLDPAVTQNVRQGDKLIIKTPGGGGYGFF